MYKKKNGGYVDFYKHGIRGASFSIKKSILSTIFSSS